MFFGNSTDDTRSLFFSSWQKYKHSQVLTPLEKQLIDVMVDHPEYHAIFEKTLDTWVPQPQQENPFLHLGLHLALRDQIALNKPEGITAIYQALYQKHGSKHYVEHLMMEHLGICIYNAQRNQCYPDESNYLNACKELLET